MSRQGTCYKRNCMFYKGIEAFEQKTCNVEYMPNTLDALRQPVFKGIMDDV